jgi:hypothetical protein
MTNDRAEAGRLGGISTAERHPGMHRVWGQRGAAPERPTLAEIKRREGGYVTVRGNLDALRRAVRGESEYRGTTLLTSTTNRTGSLRARGLPQVR